MASNEKLKQTTIEFLLKEEFTLEFKFKYLFVLDTGIMLFSILLELLEEGKIEQACRVIKEKDIKPHISSALFYAQETECPKVVEFLKYQAGV